MERNSNSASGLQKLKYITDSSSLLELERGTVHVWHLPYDSVSLTGEFVNPDYLSEEERNCASKFKFDKDRNLYLLSHCALRLVLSVYIDCSPAGILIERSCLGKPLLSSRQNQNDIRFNMSHSGRFIAIAIAKSKEVGIDIECIKDIPEAAGIVYALFDEEEALVLERTPLTRQGEVFLSLWTRKEAYLKATGAGLFAMKRSLVDRMQNVQRYTITELELDKDYKAALAVEGNGVSFRLFCLRDHK